MKPEDWQDWLDRKDSPNRQKFQYGLYHVLRAICRKFDRVSSIKRTSLYFKSRVRPAINNTSNYSQGSTIRVGSQTTLNAQPRFKIHKSNSNNLNNALRLQESLKLEDWKDWRDRKTVLIDINFNTVYITFYEKSVENSTESPL